MEENQRRVDDAWTRREREFDQHNQTVRVPRCVETPVVRPNPSLLGTPAQRNTFADEMLARERANIATGVSDELASEGRVHCNIRPQRHE